MKMRWTYFAGMFLFALVGAGVARAQTLGDTAAAMGVSGAMQNDATRGAQQQINRAAAIAGRPAPGTPPASGPAAAAPAARPAAQAGAAIPSPGGAPRNTASVSSAPPPEEAAVDLHLPFKQSFFFTPPDIIKIKKALEDHENNNIGPVDSGGSSGPSAVNIPTIRRIVLSGIIYTNPQNWIIWLNGQKVTPIYSMPEIESIQVDKDIVHLHWFDIGADKILKIDLRPHETYDIMTGVLMPGHLPAPPPPPPAPEEKKQ